MAFFTLRRGNPITRQLAFFLTLGGALLAPLPAGAQPVAAPAQSRAATSHRRERLPPLRDEEYQAVMNLSSPDPEVREKAAERLVEDDAAPIAAAPALLATAQRESNPEALAAMLRALGATGVREARPLIEAHRRADDSDVREAAQDALRFWLVRNHLLPPDGDMPGPSHPIYVMEPPPGAPAARSLDQYEGQVSPPRKVEMRRQSPNAQVSGVVALAVGGAAIVGGGVLLLTALGPERTDETKAVTGGLLLGAGAGIAAVGGGLLYYGSRWVPIERDQTGELRPAAPRVHDAGMRWSF